MATAAAAEQPATLDPTTEYLPVDRAGRIENRRQLTISAISGIKHAARYFAHTTRVVQTLEDARADAKSAAIRRLMATDNPETAKPHSASSAEKVVESDLEYAAYRAKQANAEVARIEAMGDYEAAKCTASLQLTLLHELVG